jgi:hypothetical protein
MAVTVATTLLGTALIAAAQSPVSRPITPTSDVQGVTEAFATRDRLTRAHLTTSEPPLSFVAIRSPIVGGGRSPFFRPVLESREAAAKVEAKLPPTRLRARGDATWYCVPGVSECHRAHAGGMYAAAGPALRVGDWRGRRVTVCQGDDCVRVTLIDWCACAGDRVIDLYGDAFQRLAPLSTGVLQVSVRW